MMKKIFLISFEFPPLNRGGTQRPLKFVKYFGIYNIRPIVFSLSPSSYSRVFDEYFSDPATTSEIPDDCELVHVPSDDIVITGKKRLLRFIFTFFSLVSQEGKGWRKHLFRAIEQKIHEEMPAAVVVTVPPFSMAPLGVELSRRFRLPLILDMRDAWSGRNIAQYGSIIHYWLTIREERRCFSHAKFVIATSDQTLEDFKKRHGQLPSSKFHLIMNGYDKEIKEWRIAEIDSSKNEIIIGYTGSFHFSPETHQMMFTPRWRKRGHRILQYTPQREDWLYQSPYYFFRSFHRLIALEPEIAARIQIIFAGTKPAWIDAMVKEFNLESKVSFLGQLSLTESLKFQSSCDVLLVTSAKMINGQDYAIAGKTFEYISARKPILGFVTDGAEKRLLEETGVAVVCNPDDPDRSAEKMCGLISGSWKPRPNAPFLSGLHRRQLTGKLSELIERCSLPE